MAQATKLTEFSSILQQLQEDILICRPVDAISFSLDYLRCYHSHNPGQSSSDDIKQSINFILLPYLMRQQAQFNEKLLEIYCNLILKQKTDDLITVENMKAIMKVICQKNNWSPILIVDQVCLS